MALARGLLDAQNPPVRYDAYGSPYGYAPPRSLLTSAVTSIASSAGVGKNKSNTSSNAQAANNYTQPAQQQQASYVDQPNTYEERSESDSEDERDMKKGSNRRQYDSPPSAPPAYSDPAQTSSRNVNPRPSPQPVPDNMYSPRYAAPQQNVRYATPAPPPPPPPSAAYGPGPYYDNRDYYGNGPYDPRDPYGPGPYPGPYAGGYAGGLGYYDRRYGGGYYGRRGLGIAGRRAMLYDRRF